MSSDLLENYSETVEMKEPHEKDLSKAKELKEKGNICFKEEDTNQALELYEQAIDYCPKEELDLLTVLFSNMSIVYFKHKDYDGTIEYASKALDIDCKFRKALINRANAYELQEKYDEALDDLKKANEINYEPHINERIRVLTRKSEEHLEKKKTEVLGTLKNLGESLLGKFGLSLNNFKTEKNDNGSYNISFQQ